MDTKTEPVQRRGAWWQQQTDGTWLKWNEGSAAWEPQAGPPPPPQTTDRAANADVFSRPIPPPSATGAPGAHYATFWQRLGASLLDGVLLVVVNLIGGFLIGFGYGALFGYNTYSDAEAVENLSSIVSIVLPWLYFAYMESSPTQATLGKRAAGIMLTDENGRRVSFGRATGRHFGKFVSVITLFVGFIMAAFTPKRQALHDMIAQCLVLQGQTDTPPQHIFHSTH
jgi:uncharacterized RDD family membrane protein YckC